MVLSFDQAAKNPPDLAEDVSAIESPTVRTGYRPEIDGLRAIAVIAVLLNHFNALLLPSGFLGVDIFFVISGFVVTSSLSRKVAISWKDYLLTFYARRIKRLIPALVICVVLTAVVGCFFVEDPRTSLRTGLASLIGASNLYLLKESTDYFGQSGELNLFTQTWSLGVEEQFYLVFPVLLGLCGFSQRRSRHGSRNLFFVVLSLSVLSLVGYVHLSQQLQFSRAFFLMPTRFWELGAGCLVFLSARRVRLLPFGSVKALLAPLSALVIIGLLLVSQDFLMLAKLEVVLCTSALLWAFEQKSWLVSLFSHPGLVKIGLLSYSLYLWHWSVLVISRWTVGVSKWTVPVQLLLIFGLAIASNRWIEKPLRYAQWSPGRLKTIGYGFTATFTSAVVLVGLALPLKGKLFLGMPHPERSQRTFKLSSQFKPCRDAKSISNDFSGCTYPLPADDSASGGKAIATEVTTGEMVSTTSAADRIGKTIYFVGDSHTTALLSLASQLVEAGDIPNVKAVARSGCFFSTSLVRSPLNEPQDASCQDTSNTFWHEIVEDSQAGDVIVMTMRYQVYFLAPNHPDSLEEWSAGGFALTAENAPISREAALVQYQQELIDVSQVLAQKGVSLVVQAPLPDWKHYPHECQPRWFRPDVLMPETCSLEATTELQQRLPIADAFQKAESSSASLHIYDPFSTFCNVERCVPFSEEGTPLFLDYNHLNNYGAEYLYGDFVAFLTGRSLL